MRDGAERNSVSAGGAAKGTPFDRADLPRHVAIIMDGNGRWAQTRGQPRTEGHKQGAVSVRNVVRAAREIGVPALTLYAFSAQNWERPAEEVGLLMKLLRDYLIDERPEIMDNGIRLVAIGDIDRLPDFVRGPLDDLMRDSAGHRDMTLCLALSYGGRESMVAAVRDLATRCAQGEIKPGDISADRITAALQTAGLPPLDLLVRTSGEVRLSNFLLWESAYAELYFTDTFWPDFGKADLLKALESFRSRERRFGLTREQIRKTG